jgi:hypothetical protein
MHSLSTTSLPASPLSQQRKQVNSRVAVEWEENPVVERYGAVDGALDAVETVVSEAQAGRGISRSWYGAPGRW